MRTGRPRQHDGEYVLDTALNLFWRQGYQATSLHDLVQATAVSKSSLYQLFGSKQELFLCCLQRYQDRTADALYGRLERSSSAAHFIADALLQVINDGQRVGDPRGCLVMNTATEVAQRDVAIAACVTRGLNRYHHIFQHALERAQREGSIDSNQDVGLLAHYLVTVMSGLQTMVKAGSDGSMLRALVPVIMQALAPDDS